MDNLIVIENNLDKIDNELVMIWFSSYDNNLIMVNNNFYVNSNIIFECICKQVWIHFWFDLHFWYDFVAIWYYEGGS